MPDSTAIPPLDTAVIAGDVAEALRAAEAGRERVYYDAEADATAREAYYARVDPDASADEVFRTLAELLEATHAPRPAYKPAQLVYPWVDLHPDLRIRSIYSGRAFDAEELIRADAEVAVQRASRLREDLVRDWTLGPREFEATFDALEAELPFNCEHVVPQSWFAKREPMRGDLHHLFACESRCNSFRGNTPYEDFADVQEAVRTDCGRTQDGGFEPTAGKGPVARATLYFLLRYPGQVGDAERELQRERMALLLDWHGTEPAGDYERHRNAAIAELQGNRNPLVDHPEWAERIGFEAGFALVPARRGRFRRPAAEAADRTAEAQPGR